MALRWSIGLVSLPSLFFGDSGQDKVISVESVRSSDVRRAWQIELFE